MRPHLTRGYGYHGSRRGWIHLPGAAHLNRRRADVAQDHPAGHARDRFRYCGATASASLSTARLSHEVYCWSMT
jgi:hypothetical protein